MRIISFIFIFILLSLVGLGQVGVGTNTPHQSAQLDVSSNNKGFLPPRMTSAERNSIPNPAFGLIIFNTTTNKLEIFTGVWSLISVDLFPIKKLLGGSDLETPQQIQQTTDGGYIAIGFTRSSNSGTLAGFISNGGLQDCWIIKFNSLGNITWQKLLGGNLQDLGYSILQTSDGGYIVAGSSSSGNTGTLSGIMGYGSLDLWIIKLDASGNTSWQKLYGGNDAEIGYNIKQTPDSGYIVAASSSSSNTGTLTGLINHGFFSYDYWILKLDVAGNIIWQKLLGGDSAEEPYSINLTSDGGYILAGYSISSNTGDLTGYTNAGVYDWWIVKLNGSGTISWQRLIGCLNEDRAKSIQQTSDGGYIASGSWNCGTSGGDSWVIKFDSNGITLWQKLSGISQNDNFNCIQQLNDGSYIITGFAVGNNTGLLTGISGNGGTDCWVLKLDASGNVAWQKLLGGSAADYGQSIVQTSDGGFIVFGYSGSSNSGTFQGVINNGMDDWFILKLDANGNPH